VLRREASRELQRDRRGARGACAAERGVTRVPAATVFDADVDVLAPLPSVK